MRPLTPVLMLAALATPLATFGLPHPANAEAVRAACLASDRQAAAPRLCKCIQVAADATLDLGEQNLAASFFEDPHQAQVVRQSKNRSDGLFWERYKDFSALAEAFCDS